MDLGVRKIVFHFFNSWEVGLGSSLGWQVRWGGEVKKYVETESGLGQDEMEVGAGHI